MCTRRPGLLTNPLQVGQGGEPREQRLEVSLVHGRRTHHAEVVGELPQERLVDVAHELGNSGSLSIERLLVILLLNRS